jgi:hypothetical protein
MALFQELDGGSHVDVVTGRHSPLPPCSAGQTVVVSNADHDFFLWPWMGRLASAEHRAAVQKNRPQAALRAINSG